MILRCLVLIWLGCLTATAHAGEPKRLALLIGNQDYNRQIGPLQNPANDVNLIAQTLQQIGFKAHAIRVVANASRRTILAEVDKYIDRLVAAGNNAVGFFYYSGHGAANHRDQRNYLIPVDAKTLDGSVWYDAVKLDDVVEKLNRLASNAAHFVIFDACRNLLRMRTKGGKGFVPIAERRGMLIAFSTDPGQTASDQGISAGPYAAALARELARPDQHHLDLFQNVKERVYRTTGTQVPWERNGLLKRVYLAGRPGTARPAARAPGVDAAQTAWNAIAASQDPEILNAFVQSYPTSFFAVLARKRLADLAAPSEATPTSQNNAAVAEAENAKVGDVARKLASGKLVLNGPKWAGSDGFQRVSNKEAEARLSGYTVVYANGSREYHAPDGTTKIWRKSRNTYSYGDWSVSATGKLSYRYGRRQGCWGYILYNAATHEFRVDWRKTSCKYGFARFIAGEHLR